MERYTESKLHLLVHFFIGGTDEEFAAHLQREAGITDEVGVQEHTHGWNVQIGKGFSREAGHVGTNVDAIKFGPNGEQQPVFLDIVKSVENPECVIPTSVWFERIDRFDSFLPRSLYFPCFLVSYFVASSKIGKKIHLGLGGLSPVSLLLRPRVFLDT